MNAALLRYLFAAGAGLAAAVGVWVCTTRLAGSTTLSTGVALAVWVPVVAAGIATSQAAGALLVAREYKRRLQAIAAQTGVVAHSFNNVLTVAVGYLQLLGNRLETRQRKQADAALQACLGATELVTQLRTLAGRSEEKAGQAVTAASAGPVNFLPGDNNVFTRLPNTRACNDAAYGTALEET